MTRGDGKRSAGPVSRNEGKRPRERISAHRVTNVNGASSPGPAACVVRPISRHTPRSTGGKNVSPSGFAWTSVTSSRSATGSVRAKMSCASDDHDRVDRAAQRIAARGCERCLQARRDHDAGRGKCRIAADHDGGAALERLRDRRERAPPHHHRLAPGERAEMLQIGFEPPRQSAGAADHPVVGHRDDEDEADAPRGRGCPPGDLAHTATGALICGCAS